MAAVARVPVPVRLLLLLLLVVVVDDVDDGGFLPMARASAAAAACIRFIASMFCVGLILSFVPLFR